MRAFALIGFGLAAYLSYAALTSDGVAGCGGGEGLFDCSRVLSSQWSKWLGLPVSLAAALVYALMLVALAFTGPSTSAPRRRLAWNAMLALAAAAAGSAVWFIALQFLVLDGLCVYCLSAHACSLVVAAMAIAVQPLPLNKALQGAAVGFAGVIVLVVVQLAVKPQAQGYEVERFVNTDGGETVVLALDHRDRDPVEPKSPEKTQDDDKPADQQHAGIKTPTRPPVKTGRKIAVLDGRAELNIDDYPIIGSPEAEHILVDLFDYTCHHCRTMHHHLDAALERYGDNIGIVLVMVPMNRGCNSIIRGPTHPDHRDACKLARLALAVWRTAPQQFPEFHHWLIEPDKKSRSAKEARARAIALVGEAALNDELAGWRIDEQLQLNSNLYGLAGAGKIPKLLFFQTVVRGEMETAGELFDLMEKELKIEPVQR